MCVSLKVRLPSSSQEALSDALPCDRRGGQARTWHRLIRAAGAARRAEHVERVPLLMRRNTVAPTALTRAFLAEAYGRCGDAERALLLLERAEERRGEKLSADEVRRSDEGCGERLGLA